MMLVIGQIFSPNSPFGRVNKDTIHCTLYITVFIRISAQPRISAHPKGRKSLISAQPRISARPTIPSWVTTRLKLNKY